MFLSLYVGTIDIMVINSLVNSHATNVSRFTGLAACSSPHRHRITVFADLGDKIIDPT